MTTVTEWALALLKASIQNKISTNSSFGFKPIGCMKKISFSRTVSFIRTNKFPSEKRMVSDLPFCTPKYVHTLFAKAIPVLPEKIFKSRFLIIIYLQGIKSLLHEQLHNLMFIKKRLIKLGSFNQNNSPRSSEIVFYLYILDKGRGFA